MSTINTRNETNQRNKNVPISCRDAEKQHHKKGHGLGDDYRKDMHETMTSPKLYWIKETQEMAIVDGELSVLIFSSDKQTKIFWTPRSLDHNLTLTVTLS